ncbi:cell division protein ZapA [Ampullimonas aquatilis]|uniref:cell division protein ZapA n=1 Tax=Ampullimonas aquatilis TaxID=1341549 RepID=UPI003C71E497
MTSKTIETVLMGQPYKFAVTDEDEAQLVAAIAAVDEQMKQLREKSKVKTIERIAVLTALHFAGENIRLGALEDATQMNLSPASTTEQDRQTLLENLQRVNTALDSALK